MPFVGFWGKMWSFPAFESKVECQASRKTWFETNDLDVCKVHVMAELVDMACNFGVLVKTCLCLFVLRNSGLSRSFCVAIVHKITLCAIDFVHYEWFLAARTSRSLVSNQITTSDFSLKPGTLLWTRTLGTITSYSRKPTKASCEHELHGHESRLRVTLLAYDNELRFHITDEGLSISRNVCRKITEVSGKLFP